MKLVQVEIKDFRLIEHLKLDFTDELGRVLERKLLVGPNGSGKTTVLDAIAACLGPPTERTTLRPGFELSPQGIVRRGAVRAKVTCRLRFGDEEVQAVKDIVRLSGQSWTVPDANDVVVDWQYPYREKDKEFRWGYYHCTPPLSWTLLKGRSLVAGNLHLPDVDFSWFKRVGGVFTFDQQRTGMGKMIPRDVWEILVQPNSAGEDEDRYTTDPKTILLALAVRSAVQSVTPTNEIQFEALKKAYAEVCRPRAIVGPINDESGKLDVLFNDGEYDYRYDGLSSGEQMVLLFLLRFVSEHIHNSIVLVDEVELHQHPLWQRKLVNMLPEMGEDNQFVLTTHSAYLRELAPRASIKSFGELAEPSREGAPA